MVKISPDLYIGDTGIKLGDLIKAIPPVGSVYISFYSTNPSSFFGGTWEQIKDRFPLACGSMYSVGATGGEATHILTVDELAPHDHKIEAYSSSWSDTVKNDTNALAYGSYGKNHIRLATQWNDGVKTGGGKAHNNMPPFIAVYMWRRIA